MTKGVTLMVSRSIMTISEYFTLMTSSCNPFCGTYNNQIGSRVWMSVRAMSFVSISVAPVKILLPSLKYKAIKWITAKSMPTFDSPFAKSKLIVPVMAGMPNVKSFGYWSYKVFPCPSMDVFISTSFASKTNKTVPGSARLTFPKPMGIVRQIQVGIKSINNRNRFRTTFTHEYDYTPFSPDGKGLDYP